MNQEYIEWMRSEPELFKNSGKKGEIRIVTDQEEIRQVEKELQRKIGFVYEDEYVRLVRDAVIFPDMSKGTYIRILPLHPKNSVVILPVSDGRILLLRHFRHSLRKWMWEIPRGFGEHGLTAEENAQKELKEETGIKEVELEYIGKICPDSGMSSNQVSVFFTEFSSDCCLRKQDEREAILEYRMVSLKELREMTESGEMIDSFTLSAVALAGLQGKL